MEAGDKEVEYIVDILPLFLFSYLLLFGNVEKSHNWRKSSIGVAQEDDPFWLTWKIPDLKKKSFLTYFLLLTL